MTELVKLISRAHKGFSNYRLAILMFLCILLGGDSGYDIGLKYILYIFSIIAVASCLNAQTRDWRNLLNVPVCLGMIFFGIFVLYLIPLPMTLSADLPFRNVVARGYELAAIERSAMPLSLTPETTYISLYDFIAPISIAVIMLLSPRSQEIKWAVMAIIVAIALSALIGLLQFGMSSDEFYLQPTHISGTGIPVGFFANPNHFAMTLVIGILISSYQLLRGMDGKKSTLQTSMVPVSAFIAISLLLIALTQCTSAIVILGVTFLPLMLVLAKSRKSRLFIFGGTVIFGALFLFDYLVLGQNLYSVTSQLTSTETGRLNIWSTVIDYPGFMSFFGTGPGSFYETYLIMTDSSDFTRIYVNEAHNDYIQIIMELGLIGAAIALAFLIWFARQVIISFTQKGGSKKEQLLLLTCLAVPILHSITDYPLRTPAIMGISVFITILIVRLKQTSS